MRSSCTLGMVCMLVLAVGAQSQPPTPGPEHKRLEVFAGNWTYQGEVKAGPAGPGGKLTGSDRNQLLGGFSLDRQVEGTGPMGTFTGRMMIGDDPVRKTYITYGYDSTGSFDSGTVTVNGTFEGRWTKSR